LEALVRLEERKSGCTPLLRVDNKSSIALIKNLVLHRQCKHIEVKYHLVRESVEIVESRWSSSGAKSN
jgi:hypothetical protein